MNEVDLSYAAGIIDGEGCITIQKSNSSTCISGYIYSLSVLVRMTDFEIPLWFNEMFGGSFGIARKAEGNRKTVYRWAIRSQEASEFLDSIFPYLKSKQSQAEVAIEFQCNRSYKYGGGRLSKPLSVLQSEEVLANKLKELHHTGDLL